MRILKMDSPEGETRTASNKAIKWAIPDLDIQFIFMKWAIKDLDIQFRFLTWAIKDRVRKSKI